MSLTVFVIAKPQGSAIGMRELSPVCLFLYCIAIRRSLLIVVTPQPVLVHHGDVVSSRRSTLKRWLMSPGGVIVIATYGMRADRR